MIRKIKIGRLFVLFALVSAIFVAGWSFWKAILGDPAFINVFAGASAVVAAAVSALVAYNSAEITEERVKPYPYPYIDTNSRYGVAQLRIRNVGGSPAHDVYLKWGGKSKPRMHSKIEGDDSPLLGSGEENSIAVILPYESVSQALDSPSKVSRQAKSDGGEWFGEVIFKDPRGKSFKHPFFMDYKNIGRGLLYDSEEPKTMYELQKIPGKIDNLISAVEGVGKSR